MEAPVPVSVSMSIVLHTGAVAGWLYMNQMNKQNNMKIISNVELMIQVKQPRSVQAPIRQPRIERKLKTFDFLKMALPAMPRVQTPMQVRTPQETLKKNLMDVKKLEDKGRINKMGPMESLDMDRKRALSQLDVAKLESKNSRAAALAQAPKLEEVGVRRASKAMIEMAEALEAERRDNRLQGLDVPSAIDSKRSARALAAQPMLPEEAAPAARPGALRRLAETLTSDAPHLQQPRQMMVVPKRVEMTEAPARRKQEQLLGKKKSVEIEGPLQHRKVTHYELPQYPSWAAAQGILEAEVQILFYVSPRGDVLENMRVEQTSGYGAMDRLAMDALKRWKFQPIGEGSGSQWGRITFRFVLE